MSVRLANAGNTTSSATTSALAKATYRDSGVAISMRKRPVTWRRRASRQRSDRAIADARNGANGLCRIHATAATTCRPTRLRIRRSRCARRPAHHWRTGAIALRIAASAAAIAPTARSNHGCTRSRRTLRPRATIAPCQAAVCAPAAPSARAPSRLHCAVRRRTITALREIARAARAAARAATAVIAACTRSRRAVTHARPIAWCLRKSMAALTHPRGEKGREDVALAPRGKLGAPPGSATRG